MASMNRVFLIGNLTRDPELRQLRTGTYVADMRLAVSRRYRTNAGEDREDTCYVDVVVWERQAQTCSEYLSKGSPLLVEGRLQMDEWEKDGQKFSKLRVVADRTQFLSSPRRGEYRDAAADAGASRSGAPERTAPAEPARTAPARPADGDRDEAAADPSGDPMDETASDNDNLPF